ncbi:hypothetical protein [Streptomyces sp. MNP-20]|uniref:hypothetical protein n=1 Tax=Streptomyces sp. MNP-20 TaxID=2721165 RepID=UPI001557B0C1|nr:hypothetical protein [Streptomyces sp. MNP-20]
MSSKTSAPGPVTAKLGCRTSSTSGRSQFHSIVEQFTVSVEETCGEGEDRGGCVRLQLQEFRVLGSRNAGALAVDAPYDFPSCETHDQEHEELSRKNKEHNKRPEGVRH